MKARSDFLRKTILLRLCLVIGVISLASSALAGEIYKRVDKDGNVSFSDKPGKDESGTKVESYKPQGNFNQVESAAPSDPEAESGDLSRLKDRIRRLEREQHAADRQQQSARRRAALEEQRDQRAVDRERERIERAKRESRERRKRKNRARRDKCNRNPQQRC